jgi:hypothetical protein
MIWYEYSIKKGGPMLEIRIYSFLNKASILQIDRRKEFKLKLLDKNESGKKKVKKRFIQTDKGLF